MTDRPYTDAETQLIAEMFHAGAKDYEIAKRLGRTTVAIKHQRRQRMGLARETLGRPARAEYDEDENTIVMRVRRANALHLEDLEREARS